MLHSASWPRSSPDRSSRFARLDSDPRRRLSRSACGLYFDLVAPATEQRIAELAGTKRARVALEAYVYAHFPLIAGVVIAIVGVEGASQLADKPKPVGAFCGLCLIGGAMLYLTGKPDIRPPRSSREEHRPHQRAARPRRALTRDRIAPRTGSPGLGDVRPRRTGRLRTRAVRRPATAAPRWIAGLRTALGSRRVR
jgi:hypothetical protein